MTDRELMQMALDALEKLNKDGWILADFEDEVYASIEALRARLAQPEPEPVAWLYEGSDIEGRDVCFNEDIFEEQKPHCKPLYTAPPQRGFIGLTDEEIDQAAWPHFIGNILPSVRLIVRQLEAKLKEKNG